MFHRFLIDGWGHWRIAKELNDQGLPSPNGKPWGTQTVKLILRNPVYTGRGIANRRTHSIYNMRSANSPTKADLTCRQIASRKQPGVRYRPRKDWVEQPLPQLEDYLGPELRDLAKAFHARVVTDAPLRPAIQPDRHVDSSFILKGILRSKQGNHPMTGRTQGSKEKPYRYYHISAACRIPCSDRTMRRGVLADPIELAVVSAVRETLLRVEDLRPRIEAAVREQQATAQRDSMDLSDLIQQRDRISKQIEFVIEELGMIGRDAAKTKIRQLETQLAAINERLAKAADAGARTDSAVVVDQILKRIADMASALDKLPPHGLRSLLRTLISRLEVDMTTLNIELELAIPNAVAFGQMQIEDCMGLGERSSSKSSLEAQSITAMIMAVFDCKRPTKDCYDCRRRAA